MRGNYHLWTPTQWQRQKLRQILSLMHAHPLMDGTGRIKPAETRAASSRQDKSTGIRRQNNPRRPLGLKPSRQPHRANPTRFSLRNQSVERLSRQTSTQGKGRWGQSRENAPIALAVNRAGGESCRMAVSSLMTWVRTLAVLPGNCLPPTAALRYQTHLRIRSSPLMPRVVKSVTEVQTKRWWTIQLSSYYQVTEKKMVWPMPPCLQGLASEREASLLETRGPMFLWTVAWIWARLWHFRMWLETLLMGSMRICWERLMT